MMKQSISSMMYWLLLTSHWLSNSRKTKRRDSLRWTFSKERKKRRKKRLPRASKTQLKMKRQLLNLPEWPKC
jgi:hypothetical protein